MMDANKWKEAMDLARAESDAAEEANPDGPDPARYRLWEAMAYGLYAALKEARVQIPTPDYCIPGLPEWIGQYKWCRDYLHYVALTFGDQPLTPNSMGEALAASMEAGMGYKKRAPVSAMEWQYTLYEPVARVEYICSYLTSEGKASELLVGTVQEKVLQEYRRQHPGKRPNTKAARAWIQAQLPAALAKEEQEHKRVLAEERDRALRAIQAPNGLYAKIRETRERAALLTLEATMLETLLDEPSTGRATLSALKEYAARFAAQAATWEEKAQKALERAQKILVAA